MTITPGDPISIESHYRLADGVYLLGCLEKGVTVHSQQVRAHNLIWSLAELRTDVESIAIIGAGIGGLTTAACALSAFPETTKITLFEKHWDICAIQQGCDNRWLHPNIYSWPETISRAPNADLPVLDWRPGRASDVTRRLIDQFSDFCDEFDRDNRLSILLGLGHCRVEIANKKIEWIGSKAQRSGSFFSASKPEGAVGPFDIVIFATGFGIEQQDPSIPTASYWRNEPIGQYDLTRSAGRFIISGFGDGALVDLCRATIERFRQDTILSELFSRDLPQYEERILNALKFYGQEKNLFDFFQKHEAGLFSHALERLRVRTRKDLKVELHISGKSAGNQSLSTIFDNRSSFLNRMLAYLLFRCGAYSINTQDLNDIRQSIDPLRDKIICRHGADALQNLKDTIVDFDSIETRLSEMKSSPAQDPTLMVKPGYFAVPAMVKGARP